MKTIDILIETIRAHPESAKMILARAVECEDVTSEDVGRLVTVALETGAINGGDLL